MSDTKHGWVTPRADGARARCGGPGVCATCDTEAMHEKMLTGLFGVPVGTETAPVAPKTTPIPAGWKLVEALRESLLWTASSLAAVGKEQDVITLEGRKRTIGEILDEANAALDAPSPASVAPGDAQDDQRAQDGKRPDLDWIEGVRVTDTVGRGWCVRIDGTDIFEDVNRYGCKGRRSFQIAAGLTSKQEAERAAEEWLTSQLVGLVAPAAGDALDKARLDWLEQHDGRFYNKDRISSIVGTGFLVAGDEQGVRHQTVRAAIDAAIAAQAPQQGEA